jgi:predicted dehydrogenase
LVVILPDGTVQKPTLGSGDPVDAFTLELSAAVNAVATSTEAPALAGELARKALVLCHAEIESVKTGERVSIK